MRRVLLGLSATLLFGIATSTAAAGPAQARIVGGATATNASWPWIVAITADAPTPNPLSQFCGGTLIDPSWVLTAAHCTFDIAGNPLATADVFAGITDLQNPGSAQARNVDGIVRHPGFVNDDTFRNDVALFHLDAPVTLRPTVQTLDLVAPNDPGAWDPGSPARVAGWGRLSEGGVLPDVLQELDIPILSNSGCAAYGPDFIPVMMICAGNLAGGQDSCQGDSGGPLIGTATTGGRVLIGAVSWGSGCARPNFPGIYANLPSYRSFIYPTMGISPPQAPTGLSVAPGTRAATVSWSQPPSARPITGYEVVARLGAAVASVVQAPATASSTTVTGLTPAGGYNFTVRAFSAAGAGPTTDSGVVGPTVVLPSVPTATAAPAIGGFRPRVGRALIASTGVWQDQGAAFALQWQSCDAVGLGCLDISGATGDRFVPTLAQVGHSIRVRSSTTNLAGTGTAVSPQSAVVLPVFAVDAARAPRVTVRSRTVTQVTLRLRAEPRTRLSIRVVDDRGRLRRAIRVGSRFDGAVPTFTKGRANGRLKGGTDLHTASVGFTANSGGSLRTVKVVVVASNDDGEHSERTFRVRVRL